MSILGNDLLKTIQNDNANVKTDRLAKITKIQYAPGDTSRIVMNVQFYGETEPSNMKYRTTYKPSDWQGQYIRVGDTILMKRVNNSYIASNAWR